MKTLIINCCCLLCGLVLASGCCAQGDPRQTEVPEKPVPTRTPLAPVPLDSSYSFIRYDLNHLVLGSDSSQWRHFAERWFEVTQGRKGKLNIVQIGSSHVQGGTFPHRIRRNVLLPFTDFVADRGMIFPYSAATKCNNPFDYRTQRSRVLDLTRNVYKEPLEQLGLCGIAVTAADSAAEITMRLTEPEIVWGTNRIVLLGESRGGVEPLIATWQPTRKNDTVGIWRPQAADRVDSTKRRWMFNLEQPVDSFRIILPCDSGQAFAVTGVYLANRQQGLSYHSIGVNGASLNDYLSKCPYFTTDLQMLKPDLVIFGIGINDASGPNYDTAVFRRQYMRLVDSIRKVSPDCAFLFITNNDSYRYAKRHYSVNNNGPLAREAFYRVAQQTGGAVWDQFAIMGGLTSMQTWYENQLAQKDRIHFTRAGYELLGDLLSNALFETLLTLQPPAPPAQAIEPDPVAEPVNDKPQTNHKAIFPKRHHGDSESQPEQVPFY